MKTQFRRLTASLLALMMCLSLFGGTVWADELPTSGMCGDNVSWSFATDTNTLTISGTGEIQSGFDEHSFSNPVYTMIINDGIVKISNSNELHDLKTIHLPNSLTSIGFEAFSGCSSLESISFPDSLTIIDENAFSGCTSLTEIAFSNRLTRIGLGAFRGCNSLSSITIPDSVVSIGGSPWWASTGPFADCTLLTNVKLSNNLTSIPQSAFSGCCSLRTIEIPSRVRKIGDSAFFGCSALASVTIPDKVKTIGDYAFCSCSGLKEITIPSSVASIGEEAFGYLDNGTEVIKNSDFIINGYTGTEAEDYAKANGFTFNSLGSAKEETPPQVTHTTVTVPAETCEHSWDLGEITKEPTCKEPGKITYKCEKCKKKQTWSLPVSKDHTWDAGTVTKEPTTTEEGVKTYTCTVCGQTKTEPVEKIPMPEPEPDPEPTPEPAPTPTKPETALTASELSSVKYDKTSKAVTVKWSRNTTGKGYELQYSTDKKFKKSVNPITIKKNKTTKTTIKKLKKGTYYVRIRTVNGKKTSAWSKSKSVKVK